MTTSLNDFNDLVHQEQEELTDYLKQHPETRGLVQRFALFAVIAHLEDKAPFTLQEFYEQRKQK